MKEEDIFEGFEKLDPESKVRTLAKMNQMQKEEEEKRQKGASEASKKLPELYSVKEAAQRMHVSEQTIHNWKDSGKIKFRKIGGSIRFTYEDLLGFCRGFDRNLVACMENNIYVDKVTREVVLFEKDKIYKIINENKIWITLFSTKWERSARFSMKRFGKFFRKAEDWEIDRIHFNFDDLS